MAGRITVAELADGSYVDLGIGLPTLVPGNLPRTSGWSCIRRTACWAPARTRPRRRSARIGLTFTTSRKRTGGYSTIGSR